MVILSLLIIFFDCNIVPKIFLPLLLQDNCKHIHIWHGKHHHHYRQTMRAEQLVDDSSQPSHASEGRSHPKGSVLAPMAGLVVKVLLKDGAQVDDGQPVMVIEAMKMEVRMNLLPLLPNF
jgi:3-methylcrotonyl-CoA carboxylase alpha subunit